MPSELVQAYLLLLAARRSGRKFFSFYNCEAGRIVVLGRDLNERV